MSESRTLAMVEVRAASAPGGGGCTAAGGGRGPAASRRCEAADRGARDGVAFGVAAGDRLRDEVDEEGGGGLLGCEAVAEEACCCIPVRTVDHSESKFEILISCSLRWSSRFRHKCKVMELRLLSRS